MPEWFVDVPYTMVGQQVFPRKCENEETTFRKRTHHKNKHCKCSLTEKGNWFSADFVDKPCPNQRANKTPRIKNDILFAVSISNLLNPERKYSQSQAA